MTGDFLSSSQGFLKTKQYLFSWFYAQKFNLLSFEIKIYNGEFDSGSELTLAARLKHASRTRTPVLAPGREWRTGE